MEIKQTETMTVKDIANVAGCAERTVRRLVLELYPNLGQKGKVTKLSQVQAFELMAKLPKKNEVGQPRTNLSYPEDRLSRIEAALEKLINIARILGEVEIDAAVFGGIYLDKMNRGQTCFNLPQGLAWLSRRYEHIRIKEVI